MKLLTFLLAAALALATGCSLSNQDSSFRTNRLAAEPQGDPVLDPPTLHCLGAYWIIRGDDNHNARVEVAYRKTGSDSWLRAPDMLMVTPGPFSSEGDHIKPPAVMVHEGRMFAGSVLFLDPATDYELKYNLIDPDGGSVEKIIQARTLGEPAASANMRIRHVIPGSGGGTGTQADPFKGLAAADADAKPGDLFLLHKGTYDAPFNPSHDGAPNQPIIWRGAGDGEAIIDGHSEVGPAPSFKMQGDVVRMEMRHDIWFENLTLCNANEGIHAPNCSHIVIRRCHFHHLIEGIHATPNAYAEKVKKGEGAAVLAETPAAPEKPAPKIKSAFDAAKEGITQGYFFISDNLLEGVMPWPATHDQWSSWPESRGIWVSGLGNIFCYNRITHWKDGMDVDESVQSVSCDLHNNDVSECFDDGCEMDGSDRNNRNYNNRYTNTMTGISFQPTHGGPIYAFRNVAYNTQTEPFKFHNNPSGVLVFQNTFVKNTRLPLLMCFTARSINNCHGWNNLFLGHATRAVDYDTPLFDCTFDYDGFGGFNPDEKVFMKWAGIMYHSQDEVRAKSPYESHYVVVDPASAFASGLQIPPDPLGTYDPKIVDLRLNPACPAVAAGKIIPGYETGPNGAAPSLGACEINAPLPHYGPRPEKK